ncbi:MAG: endo-1,4-beta-xylanase, partial [Lachnospiraceae bacterium]|nr:endo-1,4-beta-xylanase [Lachnospiraceae bacterium]
MGSSKKTAMLRRTIALLLALFLFSTPTLSFLGGGVLGAYAQEGEIIILDGDDEGEPEGDPESNGLEDLNQDGDLLNDPTNVSDDDLGNGLGDEPGNLSDDECQDPDCTEEEPCDDCLSLDGVGFVAAFGGIGFMPLSGDLADILITFEDKSVGDTFAVVGPATATVIEDDGNKVLRIDPDKENESGAVIPVDLGATKLSDYSKITVSLKSDSATRLDGKNFKVFAAASAVVPPNAANQILTIGNINYPEVTSAWLDTEGTITTNTTTADLTGEIFLLVLGDYMNNKEAIRVDNIGLWLLDACCNGLCNPCTCSPCDVANEEPGKCCYEYDPNVDCVDLLAGLAERTITNPNPGNAWNSWATVLQLNVPNGTVLQDYKTFSYDITTVVAGDPVSGAGSVPNRLQLEIFANGVASPAINAISPRYGIDRESAEISLLPTLGQPNFVGANGRVKFATNNNSSEYSDIQTVTFNKAVLVALDCDGSCDVCDPSGAPSGDIVIDFEDLSVGDIAAPFRNIGSGLADIYVDAGNQVLRFQPNHGNNAGVVIPVTIPAGKTLGDFEKITYRVKADTAVYGKDIDFIGDTRGYAFNQWIGASDNVDRRLGRRNGNIVESWTAIEFNILPAMNALAGEIDILVGVSFLDDAPQQENYYYFDDITLVERKSINYSAAADGTAGMVSSTKITLTFTDPVTALTVSEIDFVPGSGNPGLSIDDPVVVAGSDNKVWEVPLDGTIGVPGNITFSIDRLGIQAEEKLVLLHKKLESAMADIEITFDGTEPDWEDRFRANGNAVEISIDTQFGQHDDFALKVERTAAALGSYQHWVRVGQVSAYAGPGDTELNLPAGASYTITANFYVPSQAAGAKTIRGPQIFINNTNSGPSIFPSDANAGNIATDTWVEISFKTPVLTAPLDSIAFRLNASSDDNYPDYWYIDDITISQELGEMPEWDLTLPSLYQTYASYFLFGNIMDPNHQFSMDPDTKAMFVHHYNAVTAENSMKPDSYGMTGPTVPPNFTRSRELVDWANGESINAIGHTLVWHQQSPTWLNSSGGDPLTRAQAKANLEMFINAIAGEFAGDLLAWDVANEVFNDGGVFNGDWRSNLRTSSMWYRSYENGANRAAGESGADYLYDAFVFARAADPAAILYYNDYNDDNVTK